MNTYNVTLKYEDRKVGPEGRTIKVDASSIAGAIGKATREFVKSLDRKQRFDMNKGLKIEALRVTADKPAEGETAAADRANGRNPAHDRAWQSISDSMMEAAVPPDTAARPAIASSAPSPSPRVSRTSISTIL
jgi:hypothetical protein